MKKKVEKHICNPHVVMLFTVPTYQCGCGKYFSPEAIEELKSVQAQTDQKRRSRRSKSLR